MSWIVSSVGDQEWRRGRSGGPAAPRTHAPRFLNRARGWSALSLRHRVETTVAWVDRLAGGARAGVAGLCGGRSGRRPQLSRRTERTVRPLPGDPGRGRARASTSGRDSAVTCGNAPGRTVRRPARSGSMSCWCPGASPGALAQR
ncbi:RRXRR domain-containing protein [Nocardiopsis sp. CC223A]|uniref:RRXRR domain-containing protein n=1 Tax=Nocardiopsis sp. CC223A TaxID=3044051 RepID=UPI003557ABEA